MFPLAHHDAFVAPKNATEENQTARERGPLPQSNMIEPACNFAALTCGNDAVSRAVLFSCTREELIDSAQAAEIDAGQIFSYGADVLDGEQLNADDPFLNCRNDVMTQLTVSLSNESVIRQATMAAQNMINICDSQPAPSQAN
jgi:phosphoglycerate dehydrogenase-like enzyme